MMVVEEAVMPATLTIPDLTEARWQEICEEYSDYRIEYTSEGELLIMAPTDMGTGARNSRLNLLVLQWSDASTNGVVTDSSTSFLLPSGARRSPDVAWMTRARFGKKPTCPEFVVELMSPSDRRRKIHEKMLEWLANGAELGWMIDPQRQSVTIYRPGQEPETIEDAKTITGEGPVAGLEVDLQRVWEI